MSGENEMPVGKSIDGVMLGLQRDEPIADLVAKMERSHRAFGELSQRLIAVSDWLASIDDEATAARLDAAHDYVLDEWQRYLDV